MPCGPPQESHSLFRKPLPPSRDPYVLLCQSNQPSSQYHLPHIPWRTPLTLILCDSGTVGVYDDTGEGPQALSR